MKIRFSLLLSVMFIMASLSSCSFPVAGGTVTVLDPRLFCAPIGMNVGPRYAAAPVMVRPQPYFVPYGYQNARSYGTGMFRNNSCGPLGAPWQAGWNPPMNNGSVFYRSSPMPQYIQTGLNFHPHAPFQSW